MRAYVPRTLKSAAAHPVLFLLDGQNVFDDHGSYAGGWHAHDVVDRLWQQTVDAPIVVAVANGGAHRNKELGAGLSDFIDALVSDVVPRVGAQFGRASRRAIGGASLGGLASLVAWFRRNDVFDSAVVMSPSLWFSHRSVQHHIERGDWAIPKRGRLYVDAGARERGHMFTDAEEVCRWLKGNGLPAERMMWRPDRRGAHHEKHWGRRLPKALRFVFARPKP